MKHVFLGLTFSLLVSMALQAQPVRDRIKDKVDAQRTAFITTKLSLTPSEAEKFWPIYNEFRASMKDAKQDKRPDIRPEDMSDKEADAYLIEAIEGEEKEFLLKKNLVQKLRTVLPSHKIVMLFKAEEEFKRVLLEEMRARREDGDGPSRHKRN